MSAAPAPLLRPTRIPELAGIRGFAACWVFLFHVWLVAGSPAVALTAWGIDLTPFFACGWAGVDVFFVLSGFVLTWPYADRTSVQLKFSDFMRRRALRVVPAYYAQFALLLLLAAAGIIQELPSYGNTIAHLLFLHNLDPYWSGFLNNTWWTLPIEWQFYLVFPLLLTAMVRFGPLRVLPGLIVVMAIWRIGAMAWIGQYEPAAPVEYRVWLLEQLPGRIDQFFIGMAAAWLTARLWSRLGDGARARLSLWLIVLGLGAIIVLIYVLWPRRDAFWQGHWLLYVWHLLVAIPVAAVISGAALGSRLSGALMGTRPAVWLGEISYSIYLWNYVVLLALIWLGAFENLSGAQRIWWVALYSVGPVILVSAASWWLAERPFLHYRDRLPGKTTGPRLAGFIRSPWPGLAAASLAMVVVLGAARSYWLPETEVLAQCTERGAVDGPKRITAAQDRVSISGWVHDWRRTDEVRQVVAVLGDRVLARTTPTVERSDVAAALPLCDVAKPGFDLALPVMHLPMSPATIEFYAERNSGRRYRIGEVAWQFGNPRVAIDDAGSTLHQGDNRVSGWAWHPDGPVQVRWRYGDEVLAKDVAVAVRDDVAQAFPAWPGSDRSGFDLRVNLAELPRGAGDTVIEFIAPGGERAEMAGPQLENNRPIGIVLATPPRYLADPDKVKLAAWVFDEEPMASIRLGTELGGAALGEMRMVKEGVPLPGLFTDPRGVPPGDFWEDALRRGTLYEGVIRGKDLPAGVHRIVIQARDSTGGESQFPGPLFVKGLKPQTGKCAGEKFRVYLWATTSMLRAGMNYLQQLRQTSEAGCVEFGIHARVEYLRTTKGKAADFAFDPDFPDARRFHDGKEMTTTSLSEALAMADRYRVPMRILLDGGVWADSHFALSEYDVTDWLEQDERNVQWNQFGRAEPDDALRGLAGGHDDPQLGRVPTLNIYNQAYRAYKKRNLQAAVRLIAAYNRAHPQRPVSITLDPDLYINPWFYLKQWYDYNPDTLRQFREWLTHTGPYAPGKELAGQGAKESLTLDAINRIAHADWRRLEDVDPPRAAPDYASPWHQLWTAYKRHLVARHYADLAGWAAQAGLDPDRIFTAQTFIQADVSVSGDDRATGWVDEAGVSIAGAKPPSGHLGAILYGPASRNMGTPRSGPSLLANLRAADPGWEVAEMNPANIDHPERLPDHSDAYRTLSAIFNHGAGAISPMWNGVAGDLSVRPGQFKSYETLIQSPFETQLVLFLREAARVPRGSQLWPFGNAYVASDDGFAALPGTRILAGSGELDVNAVNLGVDETAGTCGIMRDTELWSIPTGAVLQLEGNRLSSGRVRLVLGDGTSTEVDWPQPAAGRSIKVELASLAEERLKTIELRFANCPVRIDRIVLADIKRTRRDVSRLPEAQR